MQVENVTIIGRPSPSPTSLERICSHPAIAPRDGTRVLSAGASSAVGTSVPSVLAVMRLITSSNLVGSARRKFLTEIAGTGKYVLPIHFPHPTTGLIEADGARFRYKFVR